MERNVGDFVKKQCAALANSKRPTRSVFASVNAPFTWPNISLSKTRSQHVFSTIQYLFSTSVSWVRIRSQRYTNEFLIVSSVNILMSKSGGSPGDLSTAKPRGWLDQLRAADFLVAAGGQTGLNQFASVVKEKCRIPVSGHVDTRPVYQVGHGVGLPDFLTGGRL